MESLARGQTFVNYERKKFNTLSPDSFYSACLQKLEEQLDGILEDYKRSGRRLKQDITVDIREYIDCSLARPACLVLVD
jgi:hypothetical protein